MHRFVLAWFVLRVASAALTLPHSTPTNITSSPLAPFARAAFEKEVVGGGFDSLRSAVSEHTSWLRANCAAQREYYEAFAMARAAAAGLPAPLVGSTTVTNGTGTAAASDRILSSAETSSLSSSRDSSPSAAAPALLAISEFNVRAISTLLDEELQQAMAATVGTAAGAPVFGLFAMQVGAPNLGLNVFRYVCISSISEVGAVLLPSALHSTGAPKLLPKKRPEACERWSVV